MSTFDMILTIFVYCSNHS